MINLKRIIRTLAIFDSVIPAKAGIHCSHQFYMNLNMDPRLRGDDKSSRNPIHNNLIQKINLGKIQTIVLTCVALILTACAPPQAPEINTQTKITKTRSAKELSSWTITGAIAAKHGAEAWSASLNWKQSDPHHYQIRLLGPLGGGSALITKKGKLVSYQDAQTHVTSSNINKLIYQQTGVHIPIQQLRYWVRGIPAPGAVQAMTRDHAGQITRLKQAGYTVEYYKYTNNNNINLPSKLKVLGNNGYVKLIIKHWKTH